MGTLAHSAGAWCALAAGITAIACGSDTPGAPSSVNPAPPQVLVVGDSLAVSPSRTENFPADLQTRLDVTGHRWRIVNAGVFGAVTADGLAMMNAAITTDTRILILELGANDGLHGVAIATIEEQLSAIVERAQARGVSVLLCGMETPPTHGFDYSVAFHNIFPRLATRYRLPLVPFLLAGVVLNPSLNGPDGVHPNAAGARQIADTVWPYLERLVVQESAVANR